MARTQPAVSRFRPRPAALRTGLPGCIVGRVVEVTPEGHARVDFPGNGAGALPARTIFGADIRPAPETPVLLVFEDADPARPIILGYPREGLAPAVTTTTATAATEQHVALSARSLVVEAGQEMVLRCGQGSITLYADGTIAVRGTRLLSRATGTNRIKGAAVRLN
jgi:hypothetical protein